MEGEEYKYWINRLNKLFEKYEVNKDSFWRPYVDAVIYNHDSTTTWGDEGDFKTDLLREEYIEEFAVLVDELFFFNQYLMHMSPEVYQ